MNPSIQSWTPVVKPMNYDAILAINGCESIEPIQENGFLGFERFCISAEGGPLFSPTSSRVNFPGPIVTGSGFVQSEDSSFPLTNIWSADISGEDVRMWISEPSAAQLAIWGALIQEPGGSTPDAIISFYSNPSIVGDQDFVFGSPGNFHLQLSVSSWPNAIQSLIATSDGAQIAIGTTNFGVGIPTGYEMTFLSAPFYGHSPLLSVIELNSFPDYGLTKSILFYLKQGQPRVIFARYIDGFSLGEEGRILVDSRAPIQSLVTSRFDQGKMTVLAKDDAGRYITITSPLYSIPLSSKGNVGTSIDGGVVFDLLTEVDRFFEKSSIAIAIDGGFLFDATAETTPLDLESASISTAIIGGEVTQVL